MSPTEIIALAMSMIGGVVAYVTLREKRAMSRDMAVQTVELEARRELAEVRKDYVRRIEELEKRVDALSDYNTQLRRILDEERAIYSRLKEQYEVLERSYEILRKRLIKAGVGSESEFPLPGDSGTKE